MRELKYNETTEVNGGILVAVIKAGVKAIRALSSGRTGKVVVGTELAHIGDANAPRKEDGKSGAN